MASQAFRFDFHGNPSFAMGHAGDCVTLALGQSHTNVSLRLTPRTAREMAAALVNAADFAEVVTRATPADDFDAEREAERVLAGSGQRAPRLPPEDA